MSITDSIMALLVMLLTICGTLSVGYGLVCLVRLCLPTAREAFQPEGAPHRDRNVQSIEPWRRKHKQRSYRIIIRS